MKFNEQGDILLGDEFNGRVNFAYNQQMIYHQICCEL
jgi:hypothetical protein